MSSGLAIKDECPFQRVFYLKSAISWGVMVLFVTLIVCFQGEGVDKFRSSLFVIYFISVNCHFTSSFLCASSISHFLIGEMTMKIDFFLSEF